MVSVPSSPAPEGTLYTRWTSPGAFLLAAIGAGIGLGNFWRFPYVTGVNGGGAFLLVHFVAMFVIVMPILVAELVIGRRGAGNPVRSMAALAREAGVSPAWRVFGVIGMIATFLVFSYSSVFAGWAVAYVPRMALGHFAGLRPDQVAMEFQAFVAKPTNLMLWHGIFVILTAVLVARGLRDGIERSFKIMMPLLFIILISMVAYAVMTGDMNRTLQFLLSVDFSRLGPRQVLTAIGTAFFTVTVGMGVLMVFGSYLDRSVNLTRAAMMIVGADLAVAFLTGFAVFPVVFAYNLNPSEGPGLVFITMTMAFAQMPAGPVVGALFFLLVTLSALTSGIAALEPLVAWVVERHGWERSEAAIGFCSGAWLLGIFCILSFNSWSDVHPLDFIPFFAESNFFQIFDALALDLLIPLAGLLLVLFAGWRLKESIVRDELGATGKFWFGLWRFLMRYVAPIALIGTLAFNFV